MAPTPPTIVSLKQSFLTAQTRLLTQPPAPTRAWRNSNANAVTNDADENIALPDKAVDDALFKLNHRLQQHARRVYAAQATRHVAEQIDQLYWNAAEAASRRGQTDDDDEEDDDAGEAAESLTPGADLADPSVIATLPLEWERGDGGGGGGPSPEAKRFAELSAELHALAERKQQASARVARLRGMRALLEPFSPPPTSTEETTTAGGAGGSGSGVQENLITRNGEVEAELHRTRMLLARVGDRVGRLRERRRQQKGGSPDSSVGSLFSERGEGVGGGGGVEDLEMEEQRKVGLLLERF